MWPSSADTYTVCPSGLSTWSLLIGGTPPRWTSSSSPPASAAIRKSLPSPFTTSHLPSLLQLGASNSNVDDEWTSRLSPVSASMTKSSARWPGLSVRGMRPAPDGCPEGPWGYSLSLGPQPDPAAGIPVHLIAGEGGRELSALEVGGDPGQQVGPRAAVVDRVVRQRLRLVPGRPGVVRPGARLVHQQVVTELHPEPAGRGLGDRGPHPLGVDGEVVGERTHRDQQDAEHGARLRAEPGRVVPLPAPVECRDGVLVPLVDRVLEVEVGPVGGRCRQIAMGLDDGAGRLARGNGRRAHPRRISRPGVWRCTPAAGAAAVTGPRRAGRAVALRPGETFCTF